MSFYQILSGCFVVLLLCLQFESVSCMQLYKGVKRKKKRQNNMTLICPYLCVQNGQTYYQNQLLQTGNKTLILVH